MFNPLDTAPYIGLRPFAEDDSIYFKGREEHILQITALLEMNKFLMVTGASGDGKSSLVYAGLVPNARAGFFKAYYTNWVVADFRPERTPLKNLSKTISKNLRIGNEESVEVELRRGFSSLVELYKSSSLFLDETSEAWRQGTDDEREDIHRKAGNLLIVTDQFEEFFTNPENYYRNAPSADSQLVINLLLETARIAIEKDLPIYIVCTMRSDYIGQCASFRGLPEFIGFSQFFVPRLKRKELIEVVREPARLHGDKISNRLVERVVYDLGEGIDQLPVLEHAMNEVWIQAGNGKEEMDLLYYAMAGGMAGKDLPPDDREKFTGWFNALPASVQGSYHKPGLSRIIDTHANKLYFSAAQRYNETHDDKITEFDAQFTIKVVFISLTKMDEGRAVRNRMTLQEITDIIDRPHLTAGVVGGLLNIFREPGNTFLRPYISEDPETHQLKTDTVLDITHESLIRNWELLTSWAQEEFEYLTVYEDFKKQLDRWVESGKSRGFLLSIGQLTYFEAWYEKLKPNAYWINRYLDPGIPAAERLNEAQQTITNAREFLRKSAQRHAITRVLVRHGVKKIASIAAVIMFVVLGVYLFLEVRKRDNERVLAQLNSDAVPLLNDARVVGFNKAFFVIFNEVLHPGSYKKTLDKLPPEVAIRVANDIYTDIAWNSSVSNPPIRRNVLIYADSLLNTPSTPGDPGARLRAFNILIDDLTHYQYFFPDAANEKLLDRNLANVRQIVIDALVKDVETRVPDMGAIDDALEHLLNNRTLTTTDINKILASVSPFEGKDAARHFGTLFPVGKRINYNRGMRLTHNAGYQQLAYLYANLGKIEPITKCLDSLVKYNPRYVLFVNNPTMIAAYLLRDNHIEAVNEVMQFYSSRRQVPVHELYELWLNNSGIFDMDLSNKIYIGENHNAVLTLQNESQVLKTFELYEASIRKDAKKPDELHFNLALFYRHRGALLSKMVHEGRAATSKAQIDSWFAQSLEEYYKIDPAYLDQEFPLFFFGKQQGVVPRRRVFLYPDHFQKVWNLSFNVPSYYSPAYFHYLVDNNKIGELYKDVNSLRSIYIWLQWYWYENETSSTTAVEKNYTPLTERDLERIEEVFSRFPNEKLEGKGNLPRLILIHNYLKSRQYDKAEAIYKKLDTDKFEINLKEPQFNSASLVYPINSFSPLMNELAAFLINTGRVAAADKILDKYSNTSNRIIAYSDAARRSREFFGASLETVQPFYDSVENISNRLVDMNFAAADPRIIAAYALGAAGDDARLEASRSIVSEVSINGQTDVVQAWIHGIAESGEYYTAYSSIPEIAILSDRLMLLDLILLKEAISKNDTTIMDYLVRRREVLYQEDYGFDTRK